MRKLILFIIPVLLTLPAVAKDKPFLDKFVGIYNKANEEKLELTRIPPSELLDSMRRVVKVQTGDELLKTRNEIKKVENFEDILVTGSFQLNTDWEEPFKKDIDRLFSGYEELFMIQQEHAGCRILGKLKKEKVTEVLLWINADFILSAEDISPSFSDSESPDIDFLSLFMSDLNPEYLINISFKKPVPVHEVLDQFGTEESDDSESSLFNNIMDTFGIGVPAVKTSATVSVEFGNWLDDDCEAKDWKIRNIDGKYGLYNASLEEILPPVYDRIKHFQGFLARDSKISMFVLGFDLLKDGKKGYANLEGKIVFETEYDDLRHFEKDGSRYMRVFKKGKQGLANEITGELIVPIEYDGIIWRGDYLELVKGNDWDTIGWDRDKDEVIGTVVKKE